MERPLVKRTSISNRGDDATFVLDWGLAGGDDGGGGVSLPNARAGEPMILCAGADRGVTVVNETRMRAVARWTNAMKARSILHRSLPVRPRRRGARCSLD